MSDQSMSLHGNICRDGKLESSTSVTFSQTTGKIVTSCSDRQDSKIDLDETSKQVDVDAGDVIAPGLIELQTNGLAGIHFTTLTHEDYEAKLCIVARTMAQNGVTGWYATVPTIAEDRWKVLLPLLRPRSFEATGGSSLLGAHVEGPYLHPTKKGAHNDTYFKTPSRHPYRELYGEQNLLDVIKLITIAPELDGAIDMIRDLRANYPHIRISLGHSTASFDAGVAGISAGATCLTHAFNAMNPFHHREPGLTGLIAQRIPSPSADNTTHMISPYFSIIPDLIHLHPSILSLTHCASPTHCILITDSIELAGLPDGIYPPNGQISYPQRKLGNRATNVADVSKGEVETLIGSCITLPDAVRNMVEEGGVDVAEAMRCASGNVARLMGLEGMGTLEAGARADLVVFDSELRIKQTWVGGRKIWDARVGGHVGGGSAGGW